MNLEDAINSDYPALVETLKEKSPIALLQLASDLSRIQSAIAEAQENKQNVKVEAEKPDTYTTRLVNGMAALQGRQQRLSVATPLLAALIAAPAQSMGFAPGSRTPSMLVKLAVDYADLLINEIQGN